MEGLFLYNGVNSINKEINKVKLKNAFTNPVPKLYCMISSTNPTIKVVQPIPVSSCFLLE